MLLRLVGAAAALAAAGTTLAAGAWSGPYQDVTQGLSAGSARFTSPPWLGPPAPGQVVLWAFATGECGSERWGAIDTAAFAAANVGAFVQAGRDYVISTGGEAGIFTCDSDEGMARFVERYQSPRLVGLDFDIEGRQTPEQISSLVQRAAYAQARWPKLRISFTLATHAASDGSRRSLNTTGEAVLAAIRATGLAKTAVINLMVMNYGPADPRWCVADAGRCDMGRSALQAARNVHEKHGVPYARIAITTMVGENDVAGNVTTLADAEHMARGARQLGLAGLHHWSIHRDQPCEAGSSRVSPRCHALPGVAPGRFGERLQLRARR
jgi:chitinase